VTLAGRGDGWVLHHFSFAKDAEDRLQTMMDRLGTNDTGTVLRDALRLYEWAIDEIEAGNKIASIDKDGKAQWIMVPAGRGDG
jgi:hypothetical protein